MARRLRESFGNNDDKKGTIGMRMLAEVRKHRTVVWKENSSRKNILTLIQNMLGTEGRILIGQIFLSIGFLYPGFTVLHVEMTSSRAY